MADNQLVVVKPSALTPATPVGILEMAKMIVDSGLAPAAYTDPKVTPEKRYAMAAVVLLRGKEIGMGPMESLSDLYPVFGQVGMTAKLIGSRLLKAGHKFKVEESTPERAVVTVTRRDGESYTQEMTMEFARGQGWAGRNKKYQDSPALMLRYRALTWAVRAIAPDCLFGMQAIEELEDTVQASPAGDLPFVEGAVRVVPELNELRDMEEPVGLGRPWMADGADYDKWTLKPAERDLFATFREEYGLSDVDAKRLAGLALDREPVPYFRDFPGDRLRLQAAILYELDAEVEDAAEKLEATEGEPE
jgi:hypothetical protein